MATSQSFDIIIAGAGMAGLSLAAALGARASIAILDMEDRPAYHSTGRSAATYEPNYGPPAMLALTRASAAFFQAPPPGFADAPLLVPRSSLFLEAEGQQAAAERLLRLGSGLRIISEDDARRICPVLRPGYARRSFLDPHTGDLDVDLLCGGFLRQAKASGCRLFTQAEVMGGEFRSELWHLRTRQGSFSAPLLVNAAGAWGDILAKRLGVRPIGLVARRRSIGVIPAPDLLGFAALPMMTDVGETWYAKPQSGKMIVSSADATAVDPHDAYADDLAVAEGIDRLMNATTIEVTRLDHSWAGLRTFTGDGSPAIGFDVSAAGFFWLVGQGGYGIQSAPALARLAASLLTTAPLPEDVLEQGLALGDVEPSRFVIAP